MGAGASLRVKGKSEEDVMSVVIKGTKIKLLGGDENERRVDMGKYCVGENGHESWATKLKFKRIDGDSEGPIRAGHVVGIYSPEANQRMDFGKIEDDGGWCDPDHHSWATHFQLKPTGDHGDDDPITYETEFFLESPEEEGKYMDIGPVATEDMDNDSWATKFKVDFTKEEMESREGAKNAMGAIFKDSQIKLLGGDENERRVDMGKYCVAENGHESWATKLKFKRIDGDSEGPIRKGHVVGIYSPEANQRLDIGKIEDDGGFCDAGHHSWATFFKLKPTGDHGDGDPITYETEFFLESPEEEGKYMDIGPAATEDMDNDSWATKFKVEFSVS